MNERGHVNAGNWDAHVARHHEGSVSKNPPQKPSGVRIGGGGPPPSTTPVHRELFALNLSKDRIAKIIAAAKAGKASGSFGTAASGVLAAPEGDAAYLTVGRYYAFCFVEGKSDYRFWIGFVKQILTFNGNRATGRVNEKVPLDSVPDNVSVLCDWFEPLLEGTKTHKDATKYKMMKASDNMHFTPAKVIITGLMMRQEGSDSADGRIFHLDEADLRNIDRYIGLTVDMMKAEEKEERALKKKAAGSKKQDGGGKDAVEEIPGQYSRSRGQTSGRHK